MNKSGRDPDTERDDKVDGEEQTPGPLLVSFTTACGVTFVLCLIWLASRWKITCLRSSDVHHVGRQDEESLSFSGPVCHPLAPGSSTSAAAVSSATSSSGGRRQQHHPLLQRHHSLWTWISNQNDRGSHHHVHQHLDVDDDDSLPSYDRQLLDLSQASDQDRVALIAYMNDSNTSSQVIIDKTLPSCFTSLSQNADSSNSHIHTKNTRPHTHDVTCNMKGVGPEKRTCTHTHRAYLQRAKKCLLLFIQRMTNDGRFPSMNQTRPLIRGKRWKAKKRRHREKRMNRKKLVVVVMMMMTVKKKRREKHN